MPMMPLSEAHTLPRWRRPESLLFLMAAAQPIGLATWTAFLNNVVGMAGFMKEIGWLSTVWEVPAQ